MMPMPPSKISSANSGDTTSPSADGECSQVSPHLPKVDRAIDLIGFGGNGAASETVNNDTLIAHPDDAEWDRVGEQNDRDLEELLEQSRGLDTKAQGEAVVAA